MLHHSGHNWMFVRRGGVRHCGLRREGGELGRGEGPLRGFSTGGGIREMDFYREREKWGWRGGDDA